MKDLKAKRIYEKATKNILSQINALKLSEQDRREAIKWARVFREVFKYDDMKQAVLTTKGKKLQNWDNWYDSGGFCRIASIPFAILMGMQDWQLMAVTKDQWDGGMDHHYLKHIPSGKFIDLTYDQFEFEGKTVPYELGHPATFGIAPGDNAIKFANLVGIDIAEILKQQSMQGK